MFIRHHDLEIDHENPFGSCKLGRRQYADVLTTIVGSYPSGFVLAINNRWGTGKSTFVRMWQQSLINSVFQCIYFNVWENDFDKEPMTALIAELKNLTGTASAKAYKTLVQKGAAITKAVLPSALKTISKGVIDIETANSAIENLGKEIADSFDKQISDYLKKKDSIKGFRDKLAEFIGKVDGERPVVFILDELDRCRPTFAVEVLEQLKHFFSVPGIVFFLSIDKEQLAAAVRGFYGTDQIDADEYLRRFIDLEFAIPKPDSADFCRYLYSFYGYEDFFSSEDRSKYPELRDDGKNFLRIATLVSKHANLTLRQIEKIFGQTRLILGSFKSNHFVLPDCFIVLSFWSAIRPKFYASLVGGRVALQEICDEYGSLFSIFDESDKRVLRMTEARLLVLFNNEFRKTDKLIDRKADSEEWTTILSSRIRYGPNDDLAEAISYVYRDFDRSQVKLSHLTDRIALTQPLVFTEA